MKLSPRSTLLLVAVGVLAVVILAALVLVVPQVRQLAAIETQLDSVDDRMTEAENLLETRQAAKADAVFTDAAALELAAAVPEHPDLAGLLIELQDLAYLANVQLRVVQPADLVQGDGYVAIPLTVTVWGGWADSVYFVQQLANLTRQIRVVETRTGTLGEDDAEVAAVEPLDVYSVETILIVEAYVVPSSSEAETNAVETPSAP